MYFAFYCRFYSFKKEKKMKKQTILKSIAIGALALTGALTFAGCSVEANNVSKAQMDSIFSTIEKGNEFMDNLSDQVGEISKQLNVQLSKKQAYNLYFYAATKLQSNGENILNNLKREYWEYREGDYQVDSRGVMYSYKTTDNKNVLLAVTTEVGERGEDSSMTRAGDFTIQYTNSLNDYVSYFKWSRDNVVSKSIVDGELILANSNYTANISLFSLFQLKENNIIGCEVLQNGNLKIRFASDVGETREDAQMRLVESGFAEISTDGKLIEEKFDYVYTGYYNDQETEFASHYEAKYYYGEITDDVVAPYIAIAEAQALTD